MFRPTAARVPTCWFVIGVLLAASPAATRAGDPVYACCIAAIGCSDQTESDCMAQNGLWVGGEPMQTCLEFTCDPCEPSGACCDGEANCTELPQSCCDAPAVYLGDGSTCAPGACDQPQGACCDETGKCAIVQGEADCPFEGGYRGDDTTCTDPDICDPAGACCTDDGAQITCSVVAESQCQSANQAFQGPDTTCTPDPCVPEPEGACCTDDGEVVFCSVETPANCAEVGQVFQGIGSVCTPDPCNRPRAGACCTDDGDLPVCTLEFELDCAGLNQAFQGAGTVCDPDPCVLGACCSSDGVSVGCAEGPPDDCFGDGKVYLGDGSVCAAPDACGGPCFETADCADPDGNGIRDDNCVWSACDSLQCVQIGVTFADMGGQFGACPPDGATDGNDRFQALNCFSNIDTQGSLGFPCEPLPPAALNVDAGGPFGLCCPDGVCDGNDAFHALNAFSGATPCACPADGGQTFACPCPLPTDPPENPVLCPPGPTPLGGVDRKPGPRADIRLQADAEVLRPGEVVEVDVLLVSELADLRGYQLHVASHGGSRGVLTLIDIAVRRDQAALFADRPHWQAFNVGIGQMVAGVDGTGIASRGPTYLATFTFRAERQARGTFRIELQHGAPVAARRTFLFSTPPSAPPQIGDVEAAIVEVRGRLRR